MSFDEVFLSFSESDKIEILKKVFVDSVDVVDNLKDTLSKDSFGKLSLLLYCFRLLLD